MEPQRSLLDLPQELLDMILSHLYFPLEPLDPNIPPPQSAPATRALTPLRLVCRAFTKHFTPIIFQTLHLEGPRRTTHLSCLCACPALARHVAALRLEISPRNFGRAWSDQIHRYPANDRVEYYLKDLRAFLGARLKALEGLRALHLGASFEGLLLGGGAPAVRSLALFASLAGVPVDAALTRLRALSFGMPAGDGELEVLFRDGVRRVLAKGLLLGRDLEVEGQGVQREGREADVPDRAAFGELQCCEIRFARSRERSWVWRIVEGGALAG